MVPTLPALSELYLADETAWLDAMSELVRSGAHTELDYANLGEYLHDMATRDRREVKSRLVQLLTHILKWEYQAEKRTRSWKNSIVVQRQELGSQVGRGVLRNHAEAILDEAYPDAVERAIVQTGLPSDSFPSECPFTLDELLTYEAAE